LEIPGYTNKVTASAAVKGDLPPTGPASADSICLGSPAAIPISCFIRHEMQPIIRRGNGNGAMQSDVAKPVTRDYNRFAIFRG